MTLPLTYHNVLHPVVHEIGHYVGAQNDDHAIADGGQGGYAAYVQDKAK
jgi:hypothetical protein